MQVAQQSCSCSIIPPIQYFRGPGQVTWHFVPCWSSPILRGGYDASLVSPTGTQVSIQWNKSMRILTGPFILPCQTCCRIPEYQYSESTQSQNLHSCPFMLQMLQAMQLSQKVTAEGARLCRMGSHYCLPCLSTRS